MNLLYISAMAFASIIVIAILGFKLYKHIDKKTTLTPIPTKQSLEVEIARVKKKIQLLNVRIINNLYSTTLSEFNQLDCLEKNY